MLDLMRRHDILGATLMLPAGFLCKLTTCILVFSINYIQVRLGGHLNEAVFV